MQPARALLLIAGVTLIAALNLVAVAQSGLGPAAPTPLAAPAAAAPGESQLSWELLQRTRTTPPPPGSEAAPEIEYPEELQALAGARVHLEGAAFLLSKSKRPTIARFALMPASVQSCCGPACTPSLNGVVLVDCSQDPIPRALWPSGGRFAKVEGTLRLAHAQDLGCAFGLVKARVRLSDAEGKVVVFEGLVRGPAQ